MTEEKVWVGLDLGLRQTRVCVLAGDGTSLHEQDCETDLQAIKDALAAFAVDCIGAIAVEAGCEIDIIRKLRNAGLPVTIFEARKASRFLAIRRSKTDKSDAWGLADLARVGRKTVSQVYLKSPECIRVRGLLVMRKRLVMMRVASEGVLRSRLALHGRKYKAAVAPGALRKRVEAELAELSAQDGVHLQADLKPLVDVCESLRAYLKKLDDDVLRLAKSHNVCKLLMEVPGVGPICALSFYTAIEDPTRFRTAADVGAYLGLVPRRYQSGETSRTMGITKSGSKLTRTHLVTAATVFGAVAPDCALKRWFVALRERAGPNRARTALARKLAVILLTMWKEGTHFELDPAAMRANRSSRDASVVELQC